MRKLFSWSPSLAVLLGMAGGILHADERDPRCFQSGFPIPKEGYCDQPYIVVNKDGSWLCTLTTGPGKEGDDGQHIAATISKDQGRTWSPLIDIEPATGPHASWAVPLLTPSGRVYVFYSYRDKVEDSAEKFVIDGKPVNSGMMGWYAFKFSDDGGRTWSEKRYRLPLPIAAVDLNNDWKGAVQMFWGIDKPNIVNGSVVFGFTRMGKYMARLPKPPLKGPQNDDWLRQTPSEKDEGWLFRSDNLFAESDPDKIRWNLLPEGGHGVRSDTFDPIQQEFNMVPLSNGDLYGVYRTAAGCIAVTSSRDAGRTWSEPEALTYSPGGRKLKNSIACPQLWRTANGRYLLWYHNNNFMHRGKLPIASRNTAWLTAGTERDGTIFWSEPELVCYDQDPRGGVSYPDLVEADGEYFISSTNKTDARVLHLPRKLLDGLWSQSKIQGVTKEGLVLDMDAGEIARSPAAMPQLPDLAAGGGFSLDLWVRLAEAKPGQVLLGSRTGDGKGLAVTVTDRDTLVLTMSDGETAAEWELEKGRLQPEKLHHVTFIVDGGPKMIAVVVDGRFCDGGEDKSFGWGRFLAKMDEHGNVIGKNMGNVTGGPTLKLDPAIKHLRIYDRYLRTTEVVGNFRAGSEEHSAGSENKN